MIINLAILDETFGGTTTQSEDKGSNVLPRLKTKIRQNRAEMSFFFDSVDREDSKENKMDNKAEKTDETNVAESVDNVAITTNNNASKSNLLKSDENDDAIPVDYEDEYAIVDSVKLKPKPTSLNNGTGGGDRNRRSKHPLESPSQLLSARESQKLSAKMSAYIKENNPSTNIEESVQRKNKIFRNLLKSYL